MIKFRYEKYTCKNIFRTVTNLCQKVLSFTISAETTKSFKKSCSVCSSTLLITRRKISLGV